MPTPPKPTRLRPGPAKLPALVRRAQRGQALHAPGDAGAREVRGAGHAESIVLELIRKWIANMRTVAQLDEQLQIHADEGKVLINQRTIARLANCDEATISRYVAPRLPLPRAAAAKNLSLVEYEWHAARPVIVDLIRRNFQRDLALPSFV